MLTRFYFYVAICKKCFRVWILWQIDLCSRLKEELLFSSPGLISNRGFRFCSAELQLVKSLYLVKDILVREVAPLAVTRSIFHLLSLTQ